MSQELFSGQWIQGENYDYGNEDELYYHNHPNTILYKSFNSAIDTRFPLTERT